MCVCVCVCVCINKPILNLTQTFATSAIVDGKLFTVSVPNLAGMIFRLCSERSALLLVLVS